MSDRSQKIASTLHKILGRILHEELDLSPYGLVTITQVKVTDGLESADVFITSTANGNTAVKHLQNNAKHIHEIIRPELTAWRVPKLCFQLDERSEQAERIERLLNRK